MKRFISRTIIMIIILSGVLIHAPEVFAQYSQEQAVKAAMIRNFAQFTRWPKNSVTDQTGNTISICLMGDESMLESFTGIRGKKIKGRSIQLRWVENITGLQKCDLLFVDKTARAEMSRIMASLKGKPVLTIGETEKFTRTGGMITFFEQENRIRFRINPETARRSGLQFSSNLLELAIIVDQSAGKEKQ